MDPSGALTYALEGSVFVTGAAVQWLRDGLGLLDNAAQSEALARSVPDSGGVVFVPALTGLGAPDWDPDARGAIFGITRGTTRAHLVRATLEAIAFEVRDVCGVMRRARRRAAAARAQGRTAAPARTTCCMQLQADQLQAGRGAAGDRGDHGAGRRVPGRPGHRGLVVTGRARGDLAAGPALRPRPPRGDDAALRPHGAPRVTRAKGWA